MFSKKSKGATEKKQKNSSLSGILWMFLGSVLTVMIGVFLYLSPLFNFDPVSSSDTTAVDYQVQPQPQQQADNPQYEFYDVLPNQEMVTIPNTQVTDAEEATNNDAADFEADVVVTAEEAAQQEVANYGVSEEEMLQPEPEQSSNIDDETIITIEEEAGTYDEPNSSDGNVQQPVASFEAIKPDLTYILQINSFDNAMDADERRAEVLMAGVDAVVIKSKSASEQMVYQVISNTMMTKQAVVQAQQRLKNNGIDSIVVEQRRN